MAESTSQSAVHQVVEALKTLHHDPNPQAKEKANAWLAEFQKSNEAWSTAQLILFAPDAPAETKLFAAQTFRSKITYDLDTLPEAHRLPLRDSLLNAIKSFASGPRVILTHICIALADLALQLTPDEWDDPPASMIELFGSDPQMAPALLEFLQVLAEEFETNLKLVVRSDFGRGAPANGKGVDKAKQVIGLLSMYVQAQGITTALQNQCFACLGAWLRTGQAPPSAVAGSPILAAAFFALSSEPLFDAAVDVLVDLIHETQELDDNMAVIQELLPHLNALKPSLLDPSTSKEFDDDGDKMRGFCRILVEAGEWYEPLILPHLESFLPLVECIAICASCEHLQVVSITTNFWWKLARTTWKAREDPKVRPLLDVYAGLVGTIIRHLHYPDDEETLSGQERDDFRAFRHSIGDTLKDCCSVLGATTCLRRSYDIIQEALASSGAAVKWQDIEAPLFSMRSMGAEVDPADNEIMPSIMDLLPKLPPHPKIRYAATLVIGRYTQWVNFHPEHIQYALPFISTALQDPSDVQLSAAGAQALKYLCKDCGAHLVPYLPQLHDFVTTLSITLGSEDLIDISAAIAHIIAAMPLSDAPQALSLFCMPLVEIIHLVTTKEASAAELRQATDALSRLDMFLAIVGSFGEDLPPACSGTLQQTWAVMDAFLAKYGANAVAAEKACIVLRRGLEFFGDETFKVAPSVLERLSSCFEIWPASSYLWITGKMTAAFSSSGALVFEASLKIAFERESTKIFSLLQRNPPAQLADILDDYVRLLVDIVEFTPSILFLSPVFPAAFQTALSTSTLLSTDIAIQAFDVIRSVVGHESLQPDPHNVFPPRFSIAIRENVLEVSNQLVGILVEALVEGHEDITGNALTLLRVMSLHFVDALAEGVPHAIENLPAKQATTQERLEFMGRFNAAVAAQNPNQIKDAFTWLLRTTKKTRERTRILEDRR